MERYWVANGILASNECGGLVKYDDAQRALDAERRERHAVEQIAGQALGYPWFKDDQKNFPGATEADGVCIGEHVAGTIVQELASKLATLQAQLRQVEGERDEAKGNYDRACMTIASMHSAAVGTVGNGPKRGVVEDVEDLRTAYTTLRQLMEVHTKQLTELTIIPIGCSREQELRWKQSIKDLRATLAAQDAGKGA